MQKSNKPTSDLNKKPSEPIQAFYKQIGMMTKGNTEFYELLKTRKYLRI